MASTVIRVDERTSSTLRALAEEQHKPIGQVVKDLVERYEHDRFWAGLHDDFARLKADPSAWADHKAEVTAFEGGSLDGLAAEEPYYTPDEETEIEAHAKSQGW